MGNTKWYNAGKAGREYETVDIINGVEVVKRIGSNVGSTPMFSNTSTIYLTYNPKNNKIKQITCYDPVTHVKIFDIDTDHSHEDKKGVHVQYYKNGKRFEKAYGLDDEQQALYDKFKDRKVTEHD